MASGAEREGVAEGRLALDEAALCRAVPQPRMVRTEEGAALLVVALHCMMVQAGYRFVRTVRGDAEKQPSFFSSLNPGFLLRPFRSEYYLDQHWNSGPYPDLWMLEYRREDAPGAFVLQCSMAKGMIVACGSEVGNPDNVNMVGLLVSKYVPELLRCRQRTWQGVFDHQDALVEAFTQHVLLPLDARSLRPKEPPSREGAQLPPGLWAQLSPSTAQLYSAAAIATVAIAATAAWAYRRRC